MMITRRRRRQSAGLATAAAAAAVLGIASSGILEVSCFVPGHRQLRRSHLRCRHSPPFRRDSSRHAHSVPETTIFDVSVLGQSADDTDNGGANLPATSVLVQPTSLDATSCAPATLTDARRFRTDAALLSRASLVGIITGWAVAIFKLSIDAVKRTVYGRDSMSVGPSMILRPLIPALGGLAVGLLASVGPFSPGIRGIVAEVDEKAATENSGMDRTGTSNGSGAFRFLRKTCAAIITLGTGCSLGPEGPSVEVGMGMARATMNVFPVHSQRDEETGEATITSQAEAQRQRRLLLSCGAAAGVSAGFEAPVAGVFFALEIVQAAFRPLWDSNTRGGRFRSPTSSRNMGALLLSSVLSVLVAKSLLGPHSVLQVSGYNLQTPLMELPLYLFLGAASGVVSVAFSRIKTGCTSFFSGKLGPRPVQRVMESLPDASTPALGGLLCGLVGLVLPQILFLGYGTLNGLLANPDVPLPTSFLLTLLGAKIIMTAISAGSGLVGGTFAPALFLGAMVGGAFHNAVGSLFHAPGMLRLADVPAYTMAGSASVLAALFKAPMTACMLMFELTRDYNVLLPLMASAGVANVVSDVMENKLSRRRDIQQLEKTNTTTNERASTSSSH